MVSILGFILSGVRSPWRVFSRGVAWSNRGSENHTARGSSQDLSSHLLPLAWTLNQEGGPYFPLARQIPRPSGKAAV